MWKRAGLERPVKVRNLSARRQRICLLVEVQAYVPHELRHKDAVTSSTCLEIAKGEGPPHPPFETLTGAETQEQ